ncbi:MAG: hypothetical protein ABI811_03770 [Acidobacteriota bacterium]
MNTTTLATWLEEATRNLSKDSAAQVRTEIQEHYDAAREATLDEHAAVAILGDAKAANRQYRKVLLTTAEAALVGTPRWEQKLLQGGYLEIPLMIFIGGVFLAKELDLGMWLVAVAAGMCVFFWNPPKLPINTPSRGRAFRCAKWIVFVFVLAVGFRSGHRYPTTWIILPAIFLWREWRYASIRRKLPVPQWPKHLYL